MRTLLVLLFAAQLAPCATLISHTSGTNPTTWTTDGSGLHGSPISTVGGSTAVAVITYNVTLPVPTDSQTNTWTLMKNETAGGGGMAQAQYCAILGSTSASHSFTITSSGTTFAGVEILIFSGATCNAEISDMGTGSGGAGWTVNTLTTSIANDIVVQGTGFYTLTGAPSTTAINLSYNLTDSVVYVNGASYGSSAAYLQVPAGNTGPAWSFTGTAPASDVWTEVAYEASAAPPNVRHKVVSQ